MSTLTFDGAFENNWQYIQEGLSAIVPGDRSMSIRPKQVSAQIDALGCRLSLVIPPKTQRWPGVFIVVFLMIFFITLSVSPFLIQEVHNHMDGVRQPGLLMSPIIPYTDAETRFDVDIWHTSNVIIKFFLLTGDDANNGANLIELPEMIETVKGRQDGSPRRSVMIPSSKTEQRLHVGAAGCKPFRVRSSLLFRVPNVFSAPRRHAQYASGHQ